MDIGHQKSKLLAIRKREVEPWIYSYSDLVTNLLALFMMLFVVFSQGDGAKKKLKEAIKDSLKDYSVEEISKNDLLNNQIMKEVNTKNTAVPRRIVSEYIKKNALQTDVSLETLKKGIDLTFEGAIIFDKGSAELNEDSKPALYHIATLAKRLPSKYVLDVEGHSDSLSSDKLSSDNSSYKSNWELSSARAAAVADYIESVGFPATRLRVVGYAGTQPLYSDDSHKAMRADGQLASTSELGRRVIVKINAEIGRMQ